MLILFGSRRTNKEMGSSYSKYRCGNCGNERQLRVVKNRLWFTLFFVPVIPLSTKYYCLCPVCSYGKQISKAEALELVAEPVVVENKPMDSVTQESVAAVESAVEKDNSNMFAE